MPNKMTYNYLVAGLLFWSPARAIEHHSRSAAYSFTWPAIQGDTCAPMAYAWSITLSQFLSFNPGVVCPLLTAQQEYCVEWQGEPPRPSTTALPPPVITWEFSVGVPPGTSKPSMSVSSKAPGFPPAPGQTQPSVSPSCRKWHLVTKDEICKSIAERYKVTLADFYRWNPAVGNTCGTLWAGYYVCVGI